jgi:hypothetical protein
MANLKIMLQVKRNWPAGSWPQLQTSNPGVKIWLAAKESKNPYSWMIKINSTIWLINMWAEHCWVGNTKEYNVMGYDCY